MVTIALSSGILGIVIFLIIGYLIVKGVIGICKGIGHFILKIFGKE